MAKDCLSGRSTPQKTDIHVMHLAAKPQAAADQQRAQYEALDKASAKP